MGGEAGIGKSRLLLEFRRESENDDIGWLEGPCISFGRGIPYLPIVEIVQRSVGVEDSDDETSILRRVEEATAAWDGWARAGIPYLRYLLNVTGFGALEVLDIDNHFFQVLPSDSVTASGH